MQTPVVFTVPAGMQRAEMILDLNRRIQSLGKKVHFQAYDTLQGLQWNGGRLLFNSEFLKDPNSPWSSILTQRQVVEAVKRVKALNQEGVSFNLVFNSTLENIDLDDEIGNYLLQELHEEGNGVTVATRALKQHVSSNFPKYSITASICYAFGEIAQCQKACQEYDKVVMLPKFAYAMDELELMPKDKLVFIINDQCFIQCPRVDHYSAISRCYLGGNTTCSEQERNVPSGDCFMKKPAYRSKIDKESDVKLFSKLDGIISAQRKADGIKPGDMEYEFNITPSTRKALIRYGISNFELQGRDFTEDRYKLKVMDFLEKVVRDEL